MVNLWSGRDRLLKDVADVERVKESSGTTRMTTNAEKQICVNSFGLTPIFMTPIFIFLRPDPNILMMFLMDIPVQ